jgi:glutaredoxin
MTSESASDAQPKVMLYALSTCSHCKSVKKILESRGIEYESIEVDLFEGDERKKILETVKQYNDRVTFPTTVIGETVIVGSKKDKIEEALSRLEA